MTRLRALIRWIVVAAAGCAVAASAANATAAGQPAPDRLVPTATLTSSNAGGPLGFDDVAVSGQTIVAHSFRLGAILPAPEAGVSVFTEPAGGWSNETAAAQLTAADGETLGPVAVSGDTVFAGAPEVDQNGTGVVYVFTKPSGGWSGSLHETAKLVASDAQPGTALGASVAASGQSVFATGSPEYGPSGRSVHVFAEPQGGWSGTVHESAELTASDGASLAGVAVSGSTVVAAGDSAHPAVYVFNEPAGGWSGTVHEAARLPVNSLTSVAISGSTIVAGSQVGFAHNHYTIYVFAEPTGGWSGVVYPRAERTISGFDGLLGPDVAAAGNTVAALTDAPSGHECPCAGSVYALDQPLGGWTGTLRMAPSASVTTSGFEIAIDNRTLIVGASDGVHVFQILAPPTPQNSPTPAPKPSKMTLHFFLENTVIKLTNASGRPVSLPLVPGDVIIETDLLYAGNDKHHAIRATGSDHYRCVIASTGKLLCDGQVKIGGSKLLAKRAMVTRLRPESADLQITGGTGKYRGYHGVAKFTDSHRSDLTIVVHR